MQNAALSTMNMGFSATHPSRLAGPPTVPVRTTSPPSMENSPPLIGRSCDPPETLGYAERQKAMMSLRAFLTDVSKVSCESPITVSCAFAGSATVGLPLTTLAQPDTASATSATAATRPRRAAFECTGSASKRVDRAASRYRPSLVAIGTSALGPDCVCVRRGGSIWETAFMGRHSAPDEDDVAHPAAVAPRVQRSGSGHPRRPADVARRLRAACTLHRVRGGPVHPLHGRACRDRPCRPLPRVGLDPDRRSGNPGGHDPGPGAPEREATYPRPVTAPHC